MESDIGMLGSSAFQEMDHLTQRPISINEVHATGTWWEREQERVRDRQPDTQTPTQTDRGWDYIV